LPDLKEVCSIVVRDWRIEESWWWCLGILRWQGNTSHGSEGAE
jgi:hypothetical protein